MAEETKLDTALEAPTQEEEAAAQPAEELTPAAAAGGAPAVAEQSVVADASAPITAAPKADWVRIP